MPLVKVQGDDGGRVDVAHRLRRVVIWHATAFYKNMNDESRQVETSRNRYRFRDARQLLVSKLCPRHLRPCEPFAVEAQFGTSVVCDNPCLMRHAVDRWTISNHPHRVRWDNLPLRGSSTGIRRGLLLFETATAASHLPCLTYPWVAESLSTMPVSCTNAPAMRVQYLMMGLRHAVEIRYSSPAEPLASFPVHLLEW